MKRGERERSPRRRALHWRLGAGALALAALAAGCNSASRHRVLSIFFDGVPEPATTESAGANEAPQSAVAVRAPSFVQHQPYAERDCGACHDAKRTNSLLLPREELCFQCHDFDLSKKYVHGPLVAGGCLVCHDPHSSPNPHLLVSSSDGFCLDCHDRSELVATAGHEEGRTDCTSCHEPHMSDRRYLLK